MSSSQETRKKKETATPTAADSPPPIPPIWLFKKRLNLSDANVVLRQLVVEECSEAMRGVLARLVEERRSHYVRVMAKDPNEAVYELRFMNYARGTHVLFHQWGHIVAANGLKKGDTVEGWGNLVSDDDGEIYITCALDIRRQNPESSSSRERNSPSSGNREPENKRGDDGDERKTPAKGDDGKKAEPILEGE